MALCSSGGTGTPQSPISHCLMEQGSSMAEISRASASDDPYFPLPQDGEWADEDDEPIPVLKQCLLCKCYKPMDDFAKDESRKDKKQKWCRVCRSLYKKELKEKGRDKVMHGHATQDEPQQPSTEGGAMDGDNVVQEAVQSPPRKRIKGNGDDAKFRGEDLYVFKNSRLPDYKIGCSGNIDARSNSMDVSQNFYMLQVAIFPGKGYLEDTVRDMLRYCILSREVGRGMEWHTCSLQTVLSAIGQAIENDNAQC